MSGEFCIKDVIGPLVRVVGRPRVRSGEGKLETAVSQTLFGESSQTLAVVIASFSEGCLVGHFWET